MDAFFWLVFVLLASIVGFFAGMAWTAIYFVGKTESIPKEPEPPDGFWHPEPPDGFWHFGIIKAFDVSDNHTLIEFLDGRKINCKFPLPYAFKEGDFVRFYYGCKKGENGQTALNDFVQN